MKRLIIFYFLLIFSIISNAQGTISLNDLDYIKTYEVHEYSKYKTLSDLTDEINQDSIYSLLFHDQSVFPDDLGSLSNIRSLHFYQCEKLDYNEIINICLKLDNLIDLTISGISEQEFLGKIYELIQLRKLTLAGNKFNTIPAGLDKLENLEILYLGDHLSGGNQIMDFPEDIVKLKNLRVLSLEGNMDIVLDDNFYKLHNIEELNISFVKNIDFNRACKSFPNLKKLELTGIEKTSWTGISSLYSLEELSMDYDAKLLSLGNDFSKLKNLKSLKIQLKGDLYSKPELNKLASLPSLEFLSIQIIGDQDEFHFSGEGFNSLKKLVIDNRTKISISQIIEIVSNYPKLESLDLALQWKTLTPQEIRELEILSKTIDAVQ